MVTYFVQQNAAAIVYHSGALSEHHEAAAHTSKDLLVNWHNY